MTPRKRILRILAGEQPDQVPWFGDLDYWATALISRGDKPVHFKTDKAYIDWHRDLGVGFYLQGHFPFKTIIENCEVREWKNGAARCREIRTPKGVLRERWAWLPESFTEAPTEHLVKSEKDLVAYRWVHANTRYEPDYEFAARRREQIGEMGIVLAYLPKSPLMQLVAMDAGIQAVTLAHHDAPDEFAETLNAAGESHDRAAQLAVQSPAEALMIPENLSSEVVGSFFEQFVRSYQTEWAAKIAAAGKCSFIHLDGTMKGLLRQVCSTGIKVVEALTPAPVGDVPIERWAEVADSPTTILWGGIPGVYFTNLTGEDEFDRHVSNVLRVMRQQPRYVLGVADQVPPNALERRVRRVGELVARVGRYG